MIIILMGVCGSGKTTVGRLLAERLGWAFHDGDDLHSEENVQKMTAGTPLTDQDREPWLASIGGVMRACHDAGDSAVVACSALRAAYRDTLRRYSAATEFVFLRGERAVLLERLRTRKDHFMPGDLLDSQLAALEAPRRAVVVDVNRPPDEIVTEIIRELSLTG